MGIMLMIFVYFIAKKRGYPSEKRATWRELVRATIYAIPPLGMPVIILGGIIAGVMTPTEAAAAGRGLRLHPRILHLSGDHVARLPKIIIESVIGTASIVIIMSAAQPFSWILTYELAPQKVLAFFENTQMAQWQIY